VIDHESILAKIPALSAGRLSDPERREVEEHVSGCETCAGMLAMGREIASLSPHPGVMELHRFARSPRRETAASIESHLRTCASCALEVASWRRRRSRTRLRRVGAAGGLLAAGLALWFMLGPARRPSSEQPPELLVAQSIRLTGALRAPEADRSVDFDPRRELALHVQWESLEPIAEVGALQLEIAAKNEPATWSFTFDEERVVQVLRAGAEFTAVVPAGTLRSGTYELRLIRVTRPAEPPLIQGAFRMREAR
jgi:anti-sigma factor RsiW